MAFCLLKYKAMEHIAATRLMQLCAEAIVQDEQEAEHLRKCLDCRTLLRHFGEERIKSLRARVVPKPDDDTFKKTA